MSRLLGPLVILAGASVVVCSYFFMAESRGVLRFFAYDRLSPRGRRAWRWGWGLVLLGLALTVAGMLT